MKINCISVYVSAGATLAFLSFGSGPALAASATPLQTPGIEVTRSSEIENVTWEEARVEKLRHAYHLLEHADGDYGGHREAAMKSIKHASEVLGVELVGGGHSEESQWNSDRRLHEAKHLLEDLVDEGHGKEQMHIHRAIKELDKALATR